MPRRSLRELAGLYGIPAAAVTALLIIATCGVSLALALFRVYRTARHAGTTFSASGTVVVLGNVLRNGELTERFRRRLDRAKTLYDRGGNILIIVTGGETGPRKLSEAVAGKAYLIETGVPENDILAETQSRHTIENLREANRILTGKNREEPLALVTNRYHLARSQALARDTGMDWVLCAAEDELTIDIITAARMVKEAAGLHWLIVARALFKQGGK